MSEGLAAYFTDNQTTLYHGDSLAILSQLQDHSIDCCVTSPPYFGLRDYGVPPTNWPEVTYSPMVGMPPVVVPAMTCALGAEPDPASFVAHLRIIFAEVRRVLADTGTLWLNLGDSYAVRGTSIRGRSALGQADSDRSRGPNVPAITEKNLHGSPWRTAFALQDEGWILRNDIIWSKPNAMPESVSDRLSSRYEHLFMLSKSRSYWFDLDPVRQPRSEATTARYAYAFKADEHAKHGTGLGGGMVTGINEAGRNPGDVWTIATQPFAEAHFAVMPQALAERAILAGCKPVGVVLDPFSGSGTTGLAAAKHGRKYVGIDLNADYLDLSLRTRLAQPGLSFEGESA